MDSLPAELLRKPLELQLHNLKIPYHPPLFKSLKPGFPWRMPLPQSLGDGKWSLFSLCYHSNTSPPSIAASLATHSSNPWAPGTYLLLYLCSFPIPGWPASAWITHPAPWPPLSRPPCSRALLLHSISATQSHILELIYQQSFIQMLHPTTPSSSQHVC